MVPHSLENHLGQARGCVVLRRAGRERVGSDSWESVRPLRNDCTGPLVGPRTHVPRAQSRLAFLLHTVHTLSEQLFLPFPSCTCLLSPLDEFLEHVPSEVLTNLFNVWLREEAGGW